MISWKSSRNYIWGNWGQKTYHAISPELYLQFSQTGPRFLQNHKMDLKNLWFLKKVLDFGVRAIETTFGQWNKKIYDAVRLNVHHDEHII